MRKGTVVDWRTTITDSDGNERVLENRAQADWDSKGGSGAVIAIILEGGFGAAFATGVLTRLRTPSSTHWRIAERPAGTPAIATLQRTARAALEDFTSQVAQRYANPVKP